MNPLNLSAFETGLPYYHYNGIRTLTHAEVPGPGK